MNSTVKVITPSVFYTLRSMFYLLTPQETYFEKIEDIPDVVSHSANLFFAFVILEYIFNFIYKKPWQTNDSIGSVTAGVVSRFPDFFFRSIHLAGYIWVYENYHIYSLPYNSVITYIIMFLAYDMGYYWFHRAAHEVNIFWAAHQVHHSSEYYNLTTALRQSVAQVYTSWIFYLPAALFIPPPIYIIHSYMNLLYQFWIHTEIITSLGPIIEFIFNTPSHHRVHHGRNAYCIDKNYGGVLIIWDRMFGTFQAEKKDEKVAFGLVHNINTFNPLYIQLFHFIHIIKQVFAMKSLNHKLSVIFKGPGWYPGTPRLGDNNFPEIEHPVQQYNPEIERPFKYYAFVHSMVVFHTISIAQINRQVNIASEIVDLCLLINFNIIKSHTKQFLLILWALMIYSITSISTIFDKKSYAIYMELVRCVLMILFDYYNDFYKKDVFNSNQTIHTIFQLVNIVSLLLVIYVLVTKLTNNKTKTSTNVDANNNSIKQEKKTK